VTADRSNLLERFIEAVRLRQIPFCLIGGQAVNAYVEPVVSLDLDIVVAADRIADVEALAREMFHAERFPHSLNVSDPDSDVRIQVQLDPRYGAFVERALSRKVLDLELPVATIEDILQGKIWAVQDETRRGSKRQKDLADIARLLEADPTLRTRVPADIARRLIR
jgi:hypothetical protein